MEEGAWTKLDLGVLLIQFFVDINRHSVQAVRDIGFECITDALGSGLFKLNQFQLIEN